MGDEAVAKVLREAADLIETEGWVQGKFHVPGEGYCALGAIRAQESLVGAPNEVRMEAIKALNASLPPRFKSWAPLWNDYPGRKADSVIRHMRKVAKRLEEN